MTPQSFQRVRDILAAVREMPAARRNDWLGQHCSDDPEIRNEVESLLREIDQPGDNFLGTSPVAVDIARIGMTDALPGIASEQLGQFHLGRILGEGGMGVVYEAEQMHPRRKVALKLIRPLFVNPKLLRRFEHEAEFLARLEHPGIARVYEVGTFQARTGPQPYFAMELVQGESLTAFASSRKPSVRQRLELLVRICDAVQHAHHNGIIHRDLKPTNILVNERGEPKILDFGVARAVEHDVHGPTVQTETGQLVGTLPYMSPEQAMGDARNVDTRSDVYALGVIAFELLAGRLPHILANLAVPEALSVIRESPPPRLGTLDRKLAGDIEIIVGKALEKDKQRRYASAGELAQDISRFLSNQPIRARPPSSWYQLTRFARRHRMLFLSTSIGSIALATAICIAVLKAREASIVIVIVGLSAALVISLLKGREARLAQRIAEDANEAYRARQAIQKAEELGDASSAVRNFLVEMLGAAPEDLKGDDPNVRHQLDRAVSVIGEKFEGKPLVESELRGSIGELYLALGSYKQAREQLSAALEKRRGAVRVDQDLYTVELMNKKVLALYYDGEFAEAVELHRDVLARFRQLLGDEHWQTIESFRSIGGMLVDRRRYQEGESFARQGLVLSQHKFGEDYEETLACKGVIAASNLKQGRYAESEALYRELLASYRRIKGENDSNTVRTAGRLGFALYLLNRCDEAEPILRTALEQYRRSPGPDHPMTLEVQRRLAMTLSKLGRRQEAELLARQGCEILLASQGPSSPATLAARSALARIMHEAGDSSVAEVTLLDVLERTRQTFGDDSSDTADAIVELLALYRETGNQAAREPLAKELAALCHRVDLDSAARAQYLDHSKC